MKDSVVRGRLLQLLFERRNEEALPFGAAEGAIPPPPGIDERDWLQALAQLVEYGLISWTPSEGKTDAVGRSGFAQPEDKVEAVKMGGFAQITETGVDVLEGRGRAQIDIRFC
jgi:hypothetical protein